MPYHPEVEEMFAVIEERNKLWRTGRVFIEAENAELTYKECYEREVKIADARHNRTADLLNEKLKPGRHIILVDMVETGIAGNPNILYIDRERKQLAMQAQTGLKSVEPNEYQAATMRYNLGFRSSDMRFKVVRPLKGESLPEDLSNCAGIVFSGSEVNITGSQNKQHQQMVKQVENFIPKLHTQGIPQFGVCFGSQILNHSFGARVDWIKPEDPTFEEWGVVKLIKTEAGQKSKLLADIPGDKLYIHSSHGQHVDPSSVPPELVILASSDISEVHIAELKGDNTIIFIQGHPETTDAYADIAYDVTGNRPEDLKHMFDGTTSKTGEALFRRFIEGLKSE